MKKLKRTEVSYCNLITATIKCRTKGFTPAKYFSWPQVKITDLLLQSVTTYVRCHASFLKGYNADLIKNYKYWTELRNVSKNIEKRGVNVKNVTKSSR